MWPPSISSPALSEAEQELGQRLGVQDNKGAMRLQENMYWLSAAAAEMDEALTRGACTLRTCKEAAVPVMVHLRSLGRDEEANVIFREVFPYFDIHQFYPFPEEEEEEEDEDEDEDEEEEEKDEDKEEKEEIGEDEEDQEKVDEFCWSVYREFMTEVSKQYEDAVLQGLVAQQLMLLLRQEREAEWHAVGMQLAQHPWCRVLKRVHDVDVDEEDKDTVDEDEEHKVDLGAAALDAVARYVKARAGRALPCGLVALCRCTQLDGRGEPALAAAGDGSVLGAVRATAGVLRGSLYARYYALQYAVLGAMQRPSELTQYYDQQVRAGHRGLPKAAHDACVRDRLDCAAVDGLGPFLAAGLASKIPLGAVVAKCARRVCACVRALIASASSASAPPAGTTTTTSALGALATAWRHLVAFLSFLETAEERVEAVRVLGDQLAQEDVDAHGVSMSCAVDGLLGAINEYEESPDVDPSFVGASDKNKKRGGWGGWEKSPKKEKVRKKKGKKGRRNATADGDADAGAGADAEANPAPPPAPADPSEPESEKPNWREHVLRGSSACELEWLLGPELQQAARAAAAAEALKAVEAVRAVETSKTSKTTRARAQSSASWAEGWRGRGRERERGRERGRRRRR